MPASTVEYELWPQENFYELDDEFEVRGCRIALVGSHLNVEAISEGADAEAMARDYAEQLRKEIGFSRLLTPEESAGMPPRAVTVVGRTTAEKSNHRARLKNIRRAIVAPADLRLSQCYDYFQLAKNDEEHTLAQLYKMIESIEQEYGGEANTVRALGAEIKRLKKLANDRGVSSRDQRHAPINPGTATTLSAAERGKALEKGKQILRTFAHARNRA